MILSKTVHLDMTMKEAKMRKTVLLQLVRVNQVECKHTGTHIHSDTLSYNLNEKKDGYKECD